MAHVQICCELGEFQCDVYIKFPEDAKTITMRSFLQSLSDRMALTHEVVKGLEGNLQVQVRGGTGSGRYDRLTDYFEILKAHRDFFTFPSSIMLVPLPDKTPSVEDQALLSLGRPFEGSDPRYEMHSCSSLDTDGWRIQIHFRNIKAQTFEEEGFPKINDLIEILMLRKLSVQDRIDLCALELDDYDESTSVSGNLSEGKAVEMRRKARFVYESPQGAGQCDTYQELINKVTKGGAPGIIRECDIGLYFDENEKAMITRQLRYLSYIYGSAETQAVTPTSNSIEGDVSPQGVKSEPILTNKSNSIHCLHSFSESQQIDIHKGWLFQVVSTYPYAFDVGFDSAFTTSLAFSEELDDCLKATGHPHFEKIDLKAFTLRVRDDFLGGDYQNLEELKAKLCTVEKSYIDRPRRLNIELHSLKPHQSSSRPMGEVAAKSRAHYSVTQRSAVSRALSDASSTDRANESDASRSSYGLPLDSRSIADCASLTSPLSKQCEDQDLHLDRVDSGTYIAKLQHERHNTLGSIEVLTIMREHNISPASDLGLDLLGLSQNLRVGGIFASMPRRPAAPVQPPPDSPDNSSLTTLLVEEAVKSSLRPVEDRLNDFAAMLNTIAEAVGVNLLEDENQRAINDFVEDADVPSSTPSKATRLASGQHRSQRGSYIPSERSRGRQPLRSRVQSPLKGEDHLVGLYSSSLSQPNPNRPNRCTRTARPDDKIFSINKMPSPSLVSSDAFSTASVLRRETEVASNHSESASAETEYIHDLMESSVIESSSELATLNFESATLSDTEDNAEDNGNATSGLSQNPLGDASPCKSPARKLLDSVAFRARALSALSIEDPRTGSGEVSFSPDVSHLDLRATLATLASISVASSDCSVDTPIPVRRTETPGAGDLSDISTTVPDFDYREEEGFSRSAARPSLPLTNPDADIFAQPFNRRIDPNSIHDYRNVRMGRGPQRPSHPGYYRRSAPWYLNDPAYGFGPQYAGTFPIGPHVPPRMSGSTPHAPRDAGHIPAMPNFVVAHPGQPCPDPYLLTGFKGMPYHMPVRPPGWLEDYHAHFGGTGRDTYHHYRSPR